MKFNIKQFVIFIIIALLGVLYTIFADYYFEQREQTASVILNTLQDDMSEVGYILSKNVKRLENIPSHRAVLDRAAANNEFIAAIMVVNDDQTLLTTDPSYRRVPNGNKGRRQVNETAYDVLTKTQSLEGTIRFYENAKLIKLRLIFVIDRGEVDLYLRHNKIKFFIYFGVLPSVLMLLIWGLLNFFLTQPLEKLRQYLMTQNKVPKAFKLNELEEIRLSMIKTFSRLEQEQEELYRLARTDMLTGLANRNALNEYLKQLIASCAAEKKEFAFLFLDLDFFKTVNDSLGHHIGDALLQKVGQSIRELLHQGDFIARVGGDEFIILLHNYRSINELSNIVENIQKRLNNPWVIQKHHINISSSVGIAFYPKDGKDHISLMQHSDIAMYEAKKKGRAQYHFFTEELNTQVQETIALDKAMQKALKNNEYRLYYQPKVNCLTGKIIGAEALIRWVKPSGEVVPPNVFIPLAEENGFIIDLGMWVLKEALRQQQQWRHEGIDITMSINIAAKQLLQEDFGYKFNILLQEYKVDPSKLDLEITEYLFLEQTKSNFNVLDTIRQKGVSISLDDFGTGYSSLSYLKKFPIDNLKIDKSFVDDYDNEQGAVFLETIVKMGKSLNMEVIAEGVETQSQIDYLKQIGCSTYQGYYCSKPLPENDFKRYYQQKSSHPKESA